MKDTSHMTFCEPLKGETLHRVILGERRDKRKQAEEPDFANFLLLLFFVEKSEGYN